MYKITNYLVYITANILSYPVAVQIAIFFILIMMILGLAYYLGIHFIRQLENGIKKISSQKDAEINAFIRQVIYNKSLISPGLIRDDFKVRFGNLDKKKFDVIIQALEILIDENKEIKFLANYKKIIIAFDVAAQLENLLSVTNTKKRVRIFRSLSKLSLQIQDSKILPFINSKNITLRKEAIFYQFSKSY